MALKVYPGVKRPTHHISLSDGVETWGLRLEDGPRSIQEVPLTPSTVHFSGSGSKFGDWEPGISHIEQRTWQGGRGAEDFVDDPTRYYDAQSAWTITPGKLLPGLHWVFGSGLLGDEGAQVVPGGDFDRIDWRAMLADTQKIAQPFAVVSSFSPATAALWLRKRGHPHPLTVSISGGAAPDGTVLYSTQVSPEDFDEEISQIAEVDLAALGSLGAGSYWLHIHADPLDNAANRWEIGQMDTPTIVGDYYRFVNSNWVVFNNHLLYYRLTPAAIPRKWHLFEYRGALYAVDQRADGSPSRLYINGTRGQVTSATTGIVQDGNRNFGGASTRYSGAYLKIVRGKGRGQMRPIALTALHDIVLQTPLDEAPDATSEYVITHTALWTDISPTSGDLIDGVVKDVAIVGGQVLFAQGQSHNILKMRWNPGSTPPGYEFDDDGSNRADFILPVSEGELVQVYCANAEAATVRRGQAASWGSALQLGQSAQVGASDQSITHLYTHNGQVFAFKPDGRYQIIYADEEYAHGKATAGAATTLTDINQVWTPGEWAGYWVRILAGSGAGQSRQISTNSDTVMTLSTSWSTAPNATSVYQIYKQTTRTTHSLGEVGFARTINNGEAVLSHGADTYFSYGGCALQQLHENSSAPTLTSIGPDVDGGLPPQRRGAVRALAGLPGGILAAVDAGEEGISSVLFRREDSPGWHEVFRGWAAGKRVNNLYFQDSYRPRLWLSVGGELVYQDWPRHTLNPLKDLGVQYQPDSVLVSAAIDMGASRLPKMIKEITAVTENLTDGVTVGLDYQTNQDVGTNRWTNAGALQTTPEDTLPVNAGEVYRVRFRLRLSTHQLHTPPVVLATVLEGYARTPIKYQWKMKIKLSSTQRDLSGVGQDHDPDAFMNWLKQAAVQSRRIMMRSIWAQMDSKVVIVEPPSLLRQFSNNVLGFWGGVASVTIRES